MKLDTIAVIGSNSFSGATFIRYLLEKEHEVIAISRSNEFEKVFLPYKWLEKSKQNLKFYRYDLNEDLESIAKLLERKRPAYIVNFAALGMVAQSWEAPGDWYRTNVLAQVVFHEKIRKFNFLKKYVHVTTPEVYGSTDGWISENFNFQPSTPYAVSRASCDLHLKSFFKAYKFPVVFTRAANVYGPGQQLFRIIPRTILYAKLGKQLQLHGGGKSERSFVHMRDVSDATYKVTYHGIAGETYHISTNETINIVDLVKKICKMLGINFKNLVKGAEERLGKDKAYKLSSGKIRRELNWENKIGLDEGLTMTVNWIEKNFSILKKMPHNYIHKK